MYVVQNSQKFRVRVIPGQIHALGGGVRLEVEEFIQLAWHVLTGPTSLWQSVAVWALSTITTEAINREPHRVATGATAALTATDHSTAYPGGGASKKNMAVSISILPPARSAKGHCNQANRPKTKRIAQDFDDICISVAVLCVAIWASFAHPREAESDSF